MKRSEQIGDLATAQAKAQAEIGNAHKDSANPFFKSAYADLASVWDACRAPLSKYGLSIIQALETDGANVSITTLLLHVSGQWIESVLTMTAKDASPQAIGSAATYGRRYALQSIAGVAPADDDGNDATPQRASSDDRRAAPKNGNGTHKETKPIEPPAKREPSKEYKDFLFGVTGLVEKDGHESTKEERRQIIERVCLAEGITTADLWNFNNDQFAKLLMRVSDLLEPEPVGAA